MFSSHIDSWAIVVVVVVVLVSACNSSFFICHQQKDAIHWVVFAVCAKANADFQRPRRTWSKPYMITNFYDVLYRVLHHPFEPLQLLRLRQAQDLYAIYRSAFNAFAFHICVRRVAWHDFCGERDTAREYFFHILLFRWRAFFSCQWQCESNRSSVLSMGGGAHNPNDASRVCATNRRSTRFAFSFFVCHYFWMSVGAFSTIRIPLICTNPKKSARSTVKSSASARRKARIASREFHRKLLRLVL